MEEDVKQLDGMIYDELDPDSLGSVTQAVLDKDLQQLQELLQNGHPTNVTDNRGWTPLHVAASIGCVEAVQHLLVADDVQIERLCQYDLSPLYVACCGRTSGHSKVVELLLRAGADPNMASGSPWFLPLHSATKYGKLKIVKLLLDAGADPNIMDHAYCTALHLAAEVGALEIAKLLLDKGARLDIRNFARQEFALHRLFQYYTEDRAAVYNSMLECFVTRGNDVDAPTQDGSTPLMLAVQVGWDWAVDWLLDHGADVSIMKINSKQAVHFAMQVTPDSPDRSSAEDEEEVRPTVLEKLLSRTPLDKIPREKSSIFHIAIEWERYNGLRMLIDCGMKPDDFLQDMGKSIVEGDDSALVPLTVPIGTSCNTPLGYLLFQDMTQEVVDLAIYLIEKGSSVNARKPGALPPLVAALTNRHPGAYEEDGLGQQILQCMLTRDADIMYKISESDVLPSAIAVSSLFNVVGFFRLLQHGAPVHRLYTHSTLTALLQHYQTVPSYRDHKMLPWLVASWLHTASLFVARLPADAVRMFKMEWDMLDESLAQAWQQVETLISSPKGLQHLCAVKVRLVLGEGRGWKKLQHSLRQLQEVLPDRIVDFLNFRWVKTDTLLLSPPPSTRHLYELTYSSDSSDGEM